MSAGLIRRLTAADYRLQPWANGQGETLELARADDAEGMLWRLSVATVAADGPFSVLPGVDRILTVIDGPGFGLTGGGLQLQADLLVPVAFPGDVALRAEGVAAPSRDFNVMVARGRMRARVRPGIAEFAVTGGTVALYALTPGGMVVNGETLLMEPGQMVIASGFVAVFASARVLAVTLDAAA